MKSRLMHQGVSSREVAKLVERRAIASATATVSKALTACMMLAAHDALGIGETRMARLLEAFAEHADYFADFEKDDAGFWVIENQLKQRGLYELYKSMFEERDANDRE